MAGSDVRTNGAPESPEPRPRRERKARARARARTRKSVLRTNDGQLSLVCSDRNITKIFEITGLDRVFTIYPTRDEAVDQLKTSGPAA